MRINKYIASSGICSRRKADEFVLNGNVKVNGVAMKELGYDVLEDDVVEVNGKTISLYKKKKYVIVNKPLGMITSMNDEMGRPTVNELVMDIDERLYPVGRLDYNTSGLLIMTNDGDLAYKLSHPKHNIYKTYIAKVSGVVSDAKLGRLRRGVDIGGFVTSEAKAKILRGNKNTTIVEISIKEGKNRQVRKMFKAIGNPVIELQRISIGKIHLGRLAVGHYRKLTKAEIEYLKHEI